MVILETLGRIRLVRSDGTEIDELLRQPKRLALLAYLCSPKPGVWHRRDVLLAVFWSELDSQRARTALRNALYVLRQHLGDGVVRTRGDDEVCIDAELLTSDAALLEADVAAGRFEGAFDRYGGDSLPGLHIPAAAGFESWLEEERARLRGLAKSAGVRLADARERSGDFEGAATALSRTAKLDPIDESVVRRMMTLHDRTGDRAHALAAYDRFRAHLAAEFEAEPAPETVALADAIRTRRSPEQVAPFESRVAPPVTIGQAPATSLATSTASLAAKPARRVHTLRRFVLPIAALAVASSFPITGLTRRPASSRPGNLIVMPMENATGRADLAYLATGIDDEIARRLRGIGGLQTTRSAARSDWPAAARNDVALVGREFGAEVAFRGRLTTAGDSLVVAGDVIDVASGHARGIGRYAFVVDSLQNVASSVAAAVAGALFRAPNPEIRRGGSRLVDPESYRLTLLGFHAPAGDEKKALFLQATKRDPTNARAWAGLSSWWASRAFTNEMPFEEGAPIAEAAAERAIALDSLEGSAWLNLAVIRGTRARSLRIAQPLLDKAIAVDPGNLEVHTVKAALYRHAGRLQEARDAIRIARKMDPLSPGQVGREAILGLCGNDPAGALRLYRLGLRMGLEGGHRDAARALARLGRWDEAIVELRTALSADPRTAPLVDSATIATGEQGYWSLYRAHGKQQLDAALKRKRTEWVSPVRLAALRVWSGDIDGGLDQLEKAAAAGELVSYNHRCTPGFDEAHSHPRFARIMASLKPWELPDSVSRR